MVDHVLQTRGRGTELKELKRKEIQLDVQFQKTEEEQQNQVELEDAIALMDKLEGKEQQMV